MMHCERKNGFTLVEVMVALTILVAAVSMALTGYMLLLKKSNNLNTQLELDQDIQNAIERLKIDLRLSSMDEILGYPAETPPYEALSFPVASIDTNTGMIPRDPDTLKIIWDQTVVYHIVSGAPDQLTRTSFDYNSNLVITARQNILNRIVEEDGTDNLTGLNNIQTKVIFNNLLNWELKPEGGWFSTYAETVEHEKAISLGYAILEATENVLEFKAIDNGNGFDAFSFCQTFKETQKGGSCRI
jgi:prepilin-type N-terminal cleavage/methylation domain-containing protein